MGYNTYGHINDLVTEAHHTAHHAGWWEPPVRETGTLLALIHSEISEALEIWREYGDVALTHPDSPGYSHTRSIDGKPEGFWTELADTVIRIFDLAGYHEVDFEHFIKEKMRFNATRPHRHGGKHA